MALDMSWHHLKAENACQIPSLTKARKLFPVAIDIPVFGGPESTKKLNVLNRCRNRIKEKVFDK